MHHSALSLPRPSHAADGLGRLFARALLAAEWPVLLLVLVDAVALVVDLALLRGWALTGVAVLALFAGHVASCGGGAALELREDAVGSALLERDGVATYIYATIVRENS